MKVVFSLLAFLLVAPPTAFSQLVAPYLPKDCQASATTAATKIAADAQMIGVATFKASVPIATTTIDVGMNLTNGKSSAWAYLFHSASKDTILLSPFIRLLGSCTAIDLPAGSIPGGFGPGDLGLNPVPANYLQGTALLAALAKDGDYDTYHKANPDSMPQFTVLSSAVTAVLDFPAGTPFWTISWQGSGQQGEGGLTCFVHAESGQTICVGLPTSVQEELFTAGVTVMPNPVHDVMTVSLPLEWTGHTVSMEIVDQVGSVVSASSFNAAAPMLITSTSTLSNGSYIIRLRSNGQIVQRNVVLVK